MTVPLSILSAVFTLLLLFIAATRFSHVGGLGPLPDASWAVFFLGGFYLAPQWRWALATLLIGVVGIDYLAIEYYGISNYCATLAYWFIIPGYSVLWLGGAWLRGHYGQVPLDLARLAVSLVLSVTLCFLITHSAFYWLGGRVEHPTLAEWWSVFTLWYPLFLGATCAYVGLATVVHVALTRRWRSAAVLATR